MPLAIVYVFFPCARIQPVIVVVWYKASEVTLTVYDKPTLRQLNAASPSCGGTSWQYALPQVVTNTSGCPVINLVVPDFETDVVRVDERHHWPLLYLGHIHNILLYCCFPFLANRLSI